MKTIFAFLTFLVFSSAAFAEDKVVLLKLKYLVMDQVLSEVMVIGNAIDPNVSSIDDSFILTVKGEMIEGSEEFAAKLARQRRSFSYDAFTSGIEETTSDVSCLMSGPSVGWVLEVRYLTYEGFEITHNEMREVYSDAENCLFTEKIRPSDADAERAAAMMLARLQSISELYAIMR